MGFHQTGQPEKTIRGQAMNAKDFYQTLSPLEKEYWHKLDSVFQQVQPQKPEKGIQALLIRARQMAASENIPLEQALQCILQDATERTARRVQLLNQCALKPKRADN